MTTFTRSVTLFMASVLLLLLLDSTSAFVSPAPASIRAVPRVLFVSQVSNDFEHVSGDHPHWNPSPQGDGEDSDDMVQALQELGPLALQLVVVLSVKTIKDFFEYPPKLMDEWALEHNEGKMNPLSMAIKFFGVLLFKGLHDATYFPMVWTQRLLDCQSLDECEL